MYAEEKNGRVGDFYSRAGGESSELSEPGQYGLSVPGTIVFALTAALPCHSLLHDSLLSFPLTLSVRPKMEGPESAPIRPRTTTFGDKKRVDLYTRVVIKYDRPLWSLAGTAAVLVFL